jgi:hypothetical protein
MVAAPFDVDFLFEIVSIRDIADETGIKKSTVHAVIEQGLDPGQGDVLDSPYSPKDLAVLHVRGIICSGVIARTSNHVPARE